MEMEEKKESGSGRRMYVGASSLLRLIAHLSPMHVTEEYIEATQADMGVNGREPQRTAGSGTEACCASDH